jgi:hypothetical protein
MNIISDFYFSLQEDYEKYQRIHVAEDIYWVPTKMARFEIVRNKGFNSHQQQKKSTSPLYSHKTITTRNSITSSSVHHDYILHFMFELYIQ